MTVQTCFLLDLAAKETRFNHMLPILTERGPGGGLPKPPLLTLELIEIFKEVIARWKHSAIWVTGRIIQYCMLCGSSIGVIKYYIFIITRYCRNDMLRRPVHHGRSRSESSVIGNYPHTAVNSAKRTQLQYCIANCNKMQMMPIRTIDCHQVWPVIPRIVLHRDGRGASPCPE